MSSIGGYPTTKIASTVALLATASVGEAQTEFAINMAKLGTDHPGFRIEGIDPGDRSGLSVSGAGDANGDGLADLLIGAPFAGFYSGESFVVFGKPDADTVDLGTMGDGGYLIRGIRGANLSGFSVSGCGDMNGDGLCDLVVGAPTYLFWESTRTAESHVVFGKPSAETVDLNILGGRGFRIDGVAPVDRFGHSVSGAGDVNGDGFADIVIGANWSHARGVTLAGESYVIFGKSDSARVSTSELENGGFRIRGIDAFDQSGSSVCSAGDVNGDGQADIVIGAPIASPNGNTNAGEVYLVFGKSDVEPVDLGNLGDGGFRIAGINPDDRLGTSVSGAGDVNGDGLADIIVGAWGADPEGLSNAGEAYVIFGKLDTAPVDLAALGRGGFRIRGSDSDDRAGGAVSSAGDVNGDGLADVVVGATMADHDGTPNVGAAYVVFGKIDNARVNLGALGNGGFRMIGVKEGDQFGSKVSGGGDVNSDGLADVVIGAPRADPGGRSSAGESYVVFSPASPPMLPPVGIAPSAKYKFTARPGNAPRVSAGIVGDGSDDDSPASRCWIDFDGGFGPGENQVSLQTVTLTRNDNGIRILRRERLANVQWRIQSDRIGHKKTRVTLQYTNAEISGLREQTLRVWQASSPSGPWYSHGPAMREEQRNRISVTVPRLGYFVIEGEPVAQ